jgi:hypothetical protein
VTGSRKTGDSFPGRPRSGHWEIEGRAATGSGSVPDLATPPGASGARFAHAINNLLSIILSYATLVLDEVSPDDPIRMDLEQIREAGLRVSELTQEWFAAGHAAGASAPEATGPPDLVEGGDPGLWCEGTGVTGDRCEASGATRCSRRRAARPLSRSRSIRPRTNRCSGAWPRYA